MVSRFLCAISHRATCHHSINIGQLSRRQKSSCTPSVRAGWSSCPFQLIWTAQHIPGGKWCDLIRCVFFPYYSKIEALLVVLCCFVCLVAVPTTVNRSYRAQSETRAWDSCAYWADYQSYRTTGSVQQEQESGLLLTDPGERHTPWHGVGVRDRIV